MVLWLKPIAKKTITVNSFVDGTEKNITLPDREVEILPRQWKTARGRDGNLRPGFLYQPRIANLESIIIGSSGVFRYYKVHVNNGSKTKKYMMLARYFCL